MKEFLELLELIQPDNSTKPDQFVSQIGLAYLWERKKRQIMSQNKNPLQLPQNPRNLSAKELECQHGKNITKEMRSQLS